MTYTPPTPDEVRRLLEVFGRPSRSGLTLPVAAELAGVSLRTVQRWLSGESKMGYAELFTLSQRSYDIRRGPSVNDWRDLI